SHRASRNKNSELRASDPYRIATPLLPGRTADIAARLDAWPRSSRLGTPPQGLPQPGGSLDLSRDRCSEYRGIEPQFDPPARAGDSSIKQFPGQHGIQAVGHHKEDVLELASLTLVHCHDEGRFVRRQTQRQQAAHGVVRSE